jgi:hypothetical protein
MGEGSLEKTGERVMSVLAELSAIARQMEETIPKFGTRPSPTQISDALALSESI